MKDLENEISYQQNKTPSRYTLYRRDPDKEFDYYEGTERLADFLKIQDFYRVRRDNFHTQTSMQFFSSYMNATETCNIAMEWKFCDLSESVKF